MLNANVDVCVRSVYLFPLIQKLVRAQSVGQRSFALQALQIILVYCQFDPESLDICFGVYKLSVKELLSNYNDSTDLIQLKLRLLARMSLQFGQLVIRQLVDEVTKVQIFCTISQQIVSPETNSLYTFQAACTLLGCLLFFSQMSQGADADAL